ncbi:MAG TPA: hypothetical protein VGD89_11685 [Flavipsychrobacter sp.]
MKPHTDNMALRWWALVISIVNPVFAYIANATGITPRSIADVSMKYDTYFMPAGYAFSIWGVIYLSFLVYAIYQLLPAQRRRTVYDRLAVPFIVTNLLGMGWQIAFTNELLTLGTIIIAAMLVCSIILYAMVRTCIMQEICMYWLSVPFSLYMGWLSVANIANAATWLTWMGWNGGSLTPLQWAVVMVFSAGGLGLVISLYFKDWVYPLVIAWACFAISVSAQFTSRVLATDSVIVALLSMLCSAAVGVWQYLHYKAHHMINTHKPGQHAH